MEKFTPIFESIIDKYGLTTAAVYGKMWRYSKMDDGVCKATEIKIAKELGINRRTVIRSIRTLLDAGEIQDMTPDLRNRPHTYKVSATLSHTETEQSDIKSHPVRHDVTPSVTLSHMNQSLKETLEDTKEVVGVGKGKPFATSTDALQAWIGVTGMATFPTREQDTIIEALCSLWQGSASATADYLRPFWLAWIGKKSKSGRPYSRTNPSWLDWAIAGEVPKEPTPTNGNEKRAIRYEGAG